MTIWKYKRKTCLDSRSVRAGHIRGTRMISLSTAPSVFFLRYMASLKLTCVPEWLPFATQTAVNHRKVGVLFNGRSGEARGEIVSL